MIRLAYTVEAIAEEIGKSTAWVREELRHNRLPYKRIGKSPIILADDYQVWLASQPDGD